MRTARLEEKLDQVLASLKHREDPITPSSISEGSAYGSREQQPRMQTYGVPEEVNFEATRVERVWNLAGLTMSEAEANLAAFKEHHVQWFPVIHVPSDMSAEQLRHQRPFLWLNIVLLAGHSTAKQFFIGDVVRRELARAMVVESEKSIDLVLGLLVFMGW